MGDLLSKTLDGRRWNILEDVTGEDLQAVGGEVGADHSVACLASLLGLIIEGEANLLHIRSEKGERLAEVTKPPWVMRTTQVRHWGGKDQGSFAGQVSAKSHWLS